MFYGRSQSRSRSLTKKQGLHIPGYAPLELIALAPDVVAIFTDGPARNVVFVMDSSQCLCDGVSFGRIGRIVCRIGIRSGLDFLAINDPFIEPDYMVTNLLLLL